MTKSAALIDESRNCLPRTMTTENGNPLTEARGAIDFSAKATRWYAEKGKRSDGHGPETQQGAGGRNQGGI